MLNAISVDVEEYFHAANLEPYIPRTQWPSTPSRIDTSIAITLELLASTNTHATFFILGLIAQSKPDIVKRIADAGHELASHGFEHRLAYEQTPKSFFEDISHSKKLIEDIAGSEVIGYRAPNFSITDKNHWAYEVIVEAGYRYDSSTYPVWHPRYSNENKNRTPSSIDTPAGNLLSFPLATGIQPFFGRNLRVPVAGGAYWRHFPTSFVSKYLKKINLVEKIPFCCYFHPWELDALQPVVPCISPITKLRHYGGITKFPKKIRFFLESFEFAPVSTVLRNIF